MKFISPLDLWATGIQSAIQSGQIKLQRGQWLSCGVVTRKGNDQLCRYVSHTKNSITVCHWQGTSKRTTERFNKMVAIINRDKNQAISTLQRIKTLLGSLAINDLGYPLAMSEGEGFPVLSGGRVMAKINKYKRNAININGLIAELKLITKGA